jgi:uncharacterized membrane protein
MAAGYGFGALMALEPAQRRKWCLRIGLTATALFVVIAGVLVATRPAPNGAPPAILRLLNQQKYPASALFLLMTLGPAIALIPLADRAKGWLASAVTTFGRVPMFYYLLHIPLIHATALVVWFLRDGSAGSARFNAAPYVSIAPAERWSLALLYLVFAIVVAILYVPCRWYAQRKAGQALAWMRYI